MQIGPNEIIEAWSQIFPPEVVEQMRVAFAINDGAGFTIFEDTYALLAALSEDYAKEVLEMRPDLGDLIAEVRANPKRYIEQLKQSYEAGS